MSEPSTEQIRELLDSLYRVESGRILATLIRLLGDFDLAEEAMHEAFATGLSVWPSSGVPGNPRPWLISTARFKAIDTLRRRARFDASQDELIQYLEAQSLSAEASNEDDALQDDRLRLIFTCCHPSLAPEARVALTLREVCGLTTEEIAKAFLTTPRTLAQRIVRAKAKIRETRIPYEVPTPQELPERLGAVLQVIYLVFNEGYSAATGTEITRRELTGEAIRLGRLLTELQPEPEVMGLLSLMLVQESRRAARTSPTGELILLENQDRSLWNREQIAEGVALLERALKSRRFGSYTLQAAIAAVHAEAESVAATDWREIVALYDQLLRIQPSPVVQLNRAVAIAERDGPEAGLAHIDEVLEYSELANYYLAHSARAEMCRRLGRRDEARSSYEKALALTQQEPERQFLQERIRQLNKNLDDLRRGCGRSTRGKPVNCNWSAADQAALGGSDAEPLRTTENDEEDAVTVKPDSKKPTPEAQLRSYIDRCDPKDQKLFRSVRAALRKRFPTANELAYDYKSFFVINYSPTDHPLDGIVAFAGRPDGARLYFTHGPQFPDPKKLLLGSGKQTRFVRLETARQLADPDVEALIVAAIDLAKVPLPSNGKGILIIRT